MKRKLVTFITTAVMVAAMAVPTGFCFAGTSESSAASDPTEAVLDGVPVEGMSQEELDENSVMGSEIDETTEHFGDDSGQNGGKSLMASSKAWATVSPGKYYNGYGTSILKGALAKGPDVSRWQGTIDWKKAKADGVEFAIIRLGWGSNYSSQDDSQLRYNVQQCEKYDIPYGFYLYSYANTAAKNESEIDHVLRLLKGTHPAYPVYYDMEDSGTTGKCSNATIRSYAVNFCKQIKAAGYTPGVYASLSWWNSKLSTSQLDVYERWIAQWNSTGCTYSRTWKLWQCADDYHIDGISGRVDLNFAYKKFGSSSSGTSGGSAGWVTKNGNKYYYDTNGDLIKRKWFTVGGKQYYATSTGAILRSTYGRVKNYYYGFSSSGARYEDVTVEINGTDHHFNRAGQAYLCVRYATANLNKRSGPGLEYGIEGKFKKGEKVRVVRKEGGWWQDTNGSWVSSNYLSKTAASSSSSGTTSKATYKKVGNYYYGFDANGNKYKDKTVKIGGKTYHFNKAGQAYLCDAKTTANLNKRTGPGTNYKADGLFKEGTTVHIVRKSGDWWQETNGKWLNRDYLKVTKKYPY